MSQFLLLLIAVLGALLAACGGGSAPETKTEPKAESAPAPPGPAGDSVIEGKVTFLGPKPVLKPVSMDATPACARQHSKPPMSEEAIVAADGAVKNVFVWVKAGLAPGSWPKPSGMVTIDQVGCVYKPHVVGVMVDQEIQFLNSDPTNHNIHPLPRINREWNESQAPKGDPKIKSFPKQEVMIPIKCNVHPWMRVWVGVVAHPFFQVTGDDGTFSLKGLPAGEYTVEAWHERFGTQELKVKVGAKETGKADFAFKG